MAPVENLLAELDRQWASIGAEPITLRIIGSAALMLQCDYVRGTKDSDVLETGSETAVVTEQLLRLAGKGTALHLQCSVYLDIVKRALLFLPPREVFHPLSRIQLKNFKVEVLDVNDVILSKLARFHSDDVNDARAMAALGLLDHALLVERFQKAASWFAMDARASEVPKYLKHLHRIERDILGVPESPIELPAECLDE